MVLNEKLGAKPQRSLLARTVIYVLGFGLGSLAIAGILSFTMMSIADGVMPSKSSKPVASSKGPNIIGTPKKGGKQGKTVLAPKPRSKARPGRANQAPKNVKKSSDQPL